MFCADVVGKSSGMQNVAQMDRHTYDTKGA